MTQRETPAAFWTKEDETHLLNFLFDHLASGGDGANFKMATFTLASVEMEKFRTKGGPKTAKACQNKWSVVCSHPFLFFHALILSQLRHIFRAIQAIKDHTGWTWTDDRGANITEALSRYQNWLNFVKIHKAAAPFMSQGWVHLEKVTQIMPATVCGHNVF